MISKISFKKEAFRIKTEHECSRTGRVYFEKNELVPSPELEICLIALANGGLTDRQVEVCESILYAELEVLCTDKHSDLSRSVLDDLYCHYRQELMEGLIAAYAA